MEIKTTFNDAIRLFCNDMYANKRSEKTITAYTKDIKEFKGYINYKYKGIRYVQEIKLGEINDYKVWLRKMAEVGEISNSLQDRRIFALRSFFSFLKENELTSKNIMANDKYKKCRRKESPDYLETNELDIIQNTVKKVGGRNWRRNLALFCCLRYLGGRRSDILNLKWSKVNFSKQTIEVWREKADSYSVLPLHPELQKALLELNDVSPDKSLDYIFISNKGNKLSETAFRGVIEKYVKESKVKKNFNITSRIFRHSFCTNLINNNVAEAIVIEYTGHSGRDSLKYYTAAKPSTLKKVHNYL